MSIINEALKKTQTELEQGQGERPKKTGNLPFSLPAITTLVLIVILGCSLLILYFLSSRKKTTAPAAQITRQQAVIPAVSVNPAVLISPPTTTNTSSAETQPQADVLVLKGIFFDKKIPLALINNKILKEGDSIQGKKIISITEDHVEISDQEKISILEIE